MKYSSLLIIILLACCADNLIEEVVEKYDDGKPKIVEFYKKIGEKQELVKEKIFYDTGQLYSEGNYKNGKLTGKWSFYYETGNLMGTGNFHKGEDTLSRDDESYWYDMYYEEISDNLTGKIGEWLFYDYYPNNQVNISIQESFENNKIISLKKYIYYPNGFTMMNYSINNRNKNGNLIEYYRNKQIKRLINIKDGKFYGENIFFYRNGNLKAKINFINDSDKKKRGYLGIGYNSNYDKPGIIIDRVANNSPASNAGLKEQDLIIFVNEKSVKDKKGFKDLTNSWYLDDEINITIMRNGVMEKLKARLGERPTRDLSSTIDLKLDNYESNISKLIRIGIHPAASEVIKYYNNGTIKSIKQFQDGEKVELADKQKELIKQAHINIQEKFYSLLDKLPESCEEFLNLGNEMQNTHEKEYTIFLEKKTPCLGEYGEYLLEANKKYESGDKETAKELYLKAAEKGSAEAHFKLAYQFIVTPEESIYHYTEAASKGHEEALGYALDNLLFRANNLSLSNPQKALDLYHTAKKNNPELELYEEDETLAVLMACAEPPEFDVNNFIEKYNINEDDDSQEYWISAYSIWELAEEASKGGRFGNPDPELVLNLVCRGSWVPYELKLAVKDVYNNWKQGIVKDFNLCNYITSSGGSYYCSSRRDKENESNLDNKLTEFKNKLDGNSDDIVSQAYNTAVKFITLKTRNEEGHGGSGRATWIKGSQIRQKTEYVKLIEKVFGGFEPKPKNTLKESFKELDIIYQKTISKFPTKLNGIHITVEEIKDVQESWYFYIDYSVKLFIKINPSINKDIWKSWLTEIRIKQLQSISPDNY